MESEASGAVLDESGRIRVVVSKEDVRVLIGPGRRASDAMVTVLALPIFIGMAIGGGGMVTNLAAGPTPTPAWAFVGVCICGLMAFASIFVVNVLWKFFGREELVVSPAMLTMTAHLFFVRRTRSFALSSIANVRVRELQMPRHRMVRRTIAFESSGRTESSVSWLTREEGESLIRGPLKDLVARTTASRVSVA